MAKARWKRRVVMWASAAGLVLTVGAAAYSEFNAVSYRENTYGVSNRFLLWRSSISAVYRPGPDVALLTGIEMFQPGWSITRIARQDYGWRRWVPEFSHSNGGIGEFYTVQFPLWIPAMVFGAGVWWSRRRGCVVAWACGKCAYDLRGVTGGVCPECGAPANG